jgi:hypothetical protein
MLMEAIYHPTAPQQFAPWITERTTHVLVRVVTALSSIGEVRLLLPEKTRGALDTACFMSGKANFPRLPSEGREKGAVESQKMSLLDVFIQQTRGSRGRRSRRRCSGRS